MKTSRELIQEVGTWAEANFGDKHHTLLGMVEELGELCHTLLKRHQGIRGFDNEKYFIEQFSDALGDFGIYLSHYCYVKGISFTFPRHTNFMQERVNFTYDRDIGIILGHLGQALLGNTLKVNEVVDQLVTLGNRFDVDFETTVFETWEEVVQKRNWVANPKDANLQTS